MHNMKASNSFKNRFDQWNLNSISEKYFKNLHKPRPKIENVIRSTAFSWLTSETWETFSCVRRVYFSRPTKKHRESVLLWYKNRKKSTAEVTRRSLREEKFENLLPKSDFLSFLSRAFSHEKLRLKNNRKNETCIEIYEVTETVKNCAIKKEELWMRKIFIIKESRKQNNQMCVGGFLVELSFSHIHVALCVLFPLEFVFCCCRLTWHIIKLYWIKGGKKVSASNQLKYAEASV